MTTGQFAYANHTNRFLGAAALSDQAFAMVAWSAHHAGGHLHDWRCALV